MPGGREASGGPQPYRGALRVWSSEKECYQWQGEHVTPRIVCHFVCSSSAGSAVLAVVVAVVLAVVVAVVVAVTVAVAEYVAAVLARAGGVEAVGHRAKRVIRPW